ncbi:replication factor C subunit 3 [Selaginella moellendorffii]|uniref:replication factor C subunit 3 n=1 Tax=Selaginella moellendorffii TaxID=88036 RepID=UPI000D1CF0D0|nr:replication factor C subunit 3 [Selaginella moellendorffii]|eukprot:XP_024517830.1 replication factor C subunit 3 [Selaginella moellendorffii]
MGEMEGEATAMEVDDGAVDVDPPRKLTAAQKGKAPMTQELQRSGPWVEKYRPASLADVAAHKDIIDTIDRLTAENKLPHLLLYGPPGTGKTSTILAVARKLYGPQFQNMILELNASDDRGIDVVRQQIQDFASTQSISFGNHREKANVKLIILDEADAMTKDAQFSLRRIIEKYTKNTRFCLICNYVSKIIPALQSRCTRFRFPPLQAQHVRERLEFVIDQERLDVTEDGLSAIVRLSNGDMRKALNILQSTQMAEPHVTEAAVYSCTGNPTPKEIEQIASWLLNESFQSAYSNIVQLKTSKGLALVDVVRELQPFIFTISMPGNIRVPLINCLADIEYRLASGPNEKLQLGALVSAFTHTRVALVSAAR